MSNPRTLNGTMNVTGGFLPDEVLGDIQTTVLDVLRDYGWNATSVEAGLVINPKDYSRPFQEIEVNLRLRSPYYPVVTD